MTVNYKATTVVGTSHLGGKTSKFDTDLKRTRLTSFENMFCASVRSRVDAIDGKYFTNAVTCLVDSLGSPVASACRSFNSL